MSDSRFCDCTSEAQCAFGKTGRSFDICRGACPGMETATMAAYRARWAERAGFDEPARKTQTPSCGSCTGVANLVAGAIGVAKAALGFDETPRDVLIERLAACDTCDANDLGKCLKCGCFVAAKARLAAERCPKNRWGPSAGGGGGAQS